MNNVSKSFAFIAAFALLCLDAIAAPTIVSPADYATASSMSPFLQSFIGTTTMTNYTTYTTADTTARKAYAKDYKYTNGFVRLEWSGTSGNSTVTVRRLRDGATVFSETTDATSTLFYDPEIGRNYTWTVENGASTATGHFYVARNAPRIVHYKNQDGVYCLLNGRDMGGWTNTAGKVVKQGLLYRSAMVEYCTIENPKDGQGAYLPNDDLRNGLGIKLDVDLRETTDSWLNVFLGQDWSWDMSLAVSPIGPGIPRFFSENACGASFQDYKYANIASTSPSQTAKQNRSAMWHTFTNFCHEANFPILYHCMYGKDRTGTLGCILLGLLGVPKADIHRDYALSWYVLSDETMTTSSKWRLNEVFSFLNGYAGSTLAEKCASYLKQCAADAGVGAAEAETLIARYQSLLLEDPEPKFTPADPGADYVPLSIGAPADYSTISTMTERMKSHLANAKFLTYDFFKTANTDSSPNQTRLNYFHDYATNSVPTVLSWNGSGGPYTVKLWRTHIDSAETPVYVKETTEPEAVFFDLEVGRNYTWTVTDGICTATGHFFTERNAPRIVYRKQDPSVSGGQGNNTRDMGGWTGANGKVVRQGLIFRSAQLEDCNASNDDHEKLELEHLKYNLGVRFDIDFRTREFMETFYTKPPEVEQSTRWSWTHARPVIDMSNIGAGIPRYNVNKETGYEFPSSVPATGSSQASARIAHWAAFTNLLNAAERPVLFHCSEGKDRTGAFGLVVLGILGVAKDDAKKDYGLTWFCSHDNAMTSSYGYKNFEDWVTRMGNYNSSATTLQAKSRAFLLQCAADAGDAAGAGDRIDAFIDMMLEDPESADTPPPAPNDNHTIICYGDSVTRGSGADTVTMDGRTTYFGGRLAGVAEVAESYPYWLSGMLSETYDVINQSRGSTLAAHVSSWAGLQDVSVKSGFTLPRSGSVTLGKKFVFDDSTYGNEYGGIPSNEKLGGFVPPIYPLSENYAAGTTSDSIVGTLGGHRVRIQGASTSALTVTALDALSADVAIAAGTKFIPESATVEQYTNAVRVICMGGNDWIELRSGDYGTVDAYTYTYNTHIRPLAMKIKAQGGRFLVVSPVFSPLGTDPEGGELDSPVANEVEALMAADFGANYLNMRLAFVQNIDRLAQKFGIAGADEWAHSPSAFRNDQVHLTSAGYRIKAALVREKLIELGYVTEVDRPEYTTTFPYDGTEKQCVAEGSGYVIGGTYKATAGGIYQAQVSPAPGYTWTDGTTTPVVINWLIDVYSVKVSDVEALLQNHVYNGTALSCGLASNAKYTVGGATSRTDAGTYSVTVTLNNGYTWDDGDPASAKTFSWTIAKAANSWVSAPSVSRESWPAGSAPALTYSVGTPASGTAVNVAITKNGAAFDGTLAGMASWAMGFYNIAFSVAESANYSALETTLQVTVLDSAPSTPLDTTLFDTHPEWGYKVENLGAGGDEVALVFTNQAATASWTVSSALENVQFLVVGGGGGGGADLRTTRTYDTGCGGGGGGGGGVVTGLVNFAKNSVVSITVGHGGSGGRNGVSTCHKTFRFLAPWWTEQDKVYTAYGDAGEAADSSFSVGELTYVTAYAGGGDQGGKSNSDSATNLPEDGGSGAGARCGALDYSSGDGVAYYSAGTKGSAIDDHSLVPFYQTFGTTGGANKYSWGGSGGGGAVTKGGDTYCIDKKISSVLAGKNVTRKVRYPGTGGEGLASAITGTRRVYGSGGGGGFAVNAARADATESQGEIYLGPGIGALGGTGAGNGNQSIGSSTVPASGTSGVANQGGGGGGAGLFGNGGSGGSGIVVFRFVVPEVVDPSTPVDPDPEPIDVAVFNGHPEWGYAVPGLGADGNEVALVFTNQSATISFAAPGNYTNVAFLVVGGGGGGGGDNKDDDGSLGGAGGGGGGVVTGVVYRIAQNATVSVTVGAGGAGGEAKAKPGSSYSPNYHGGANPGAASVLKVDGVTYVTADGGGRDQGVNGTGSASPGTAGGPGGSSAGSRPLVTARGVATKGSIGSSATSLLTAVLFGEQGGAGNANVNYAAGGGGGATEEGGTPSDYHAGGKGGEGLGSDITGTLAVYGSGGGGGTAVSSGSVSSGGTGAGNGGKGGIAGTAGAANLGGGGGGGGGEKNGGAGGSGIVVLRVRVAEAETPDEPDEPDQPTPPTPPAPDYDRESALTIVSPSDYATIATKTPGFKSLVGDSAMLARSAFASANTAARTRYYNEYTTNSMPVALQWTAAAPATFTVKVWRTKDVEANPAAAPLFTAETEATSVLYYDPEVGRNYTWTVSDGTSVATGHFFTEAGAPRVLYADHNGAGNGADCYNGRDLGGWSAANGKVVRQGRVYRSAELDLCGPTNRFGFHTELPYLRDQIGIRLEMDLRNVSEVQGYLRNTLDWQGAVDKSCISPSIPRFNVEASCGTKFQLYDTAITAASVTNKYRKGVWSAFTNFCDEAKMPIVFHCAHGKDRAGTLAAILLGVLGVDVADVRRDFGLSWYHHKAETMDSGGYGYDMIDAALANLATYAPGGTLAEQTEAYLIQCALYSGVSAATAAERIAAFRALMLEDPETAQAAPAAPDAILGLAAAASYVTYPDPKFTVSGSATLGSGTARVLVRYSLNSEAFDQTEAVALQPDGTFSLDIPYAAATNELVWFVEAEDFGGAEVQVKRTPVGVLRRARDAAPVTYTWTGGAGDGKWTSLANWTCGVFDAYGYPLDASAAVFPAAAGGATIDLEGGTYSTSLSFAAGAGKVGFRNGTILIDAASAALGATGTAVEFGGVTVGNPSGTIALDFPGGLSVRDGPLAIQGSAWLDDVVFTDGQSEARLSASGSLTFNGTCAMALKDAGRTASFIEAASATAGSDCTFELDVTDRSAAGNVPLATFASSQSANLSATLSTKIAGAAVANRGSLVWDGATLCYAQERQTGTATVPTAATGLVYSGAEQTGVPAGEGYTLSGTSAATAAGTYTATATLKDGYSWAGQASGAVQVQWSIARGTNAWSPAPSISAASWAFGATPGVLTPGRTAFGEATATISRNGGPAEAFSGVLPEEPGAYTITYAAPEATADYAAPAKAEQTVSFRIIAEPSGFDAYACYTTYPATFKIIGRITPGSGETSVTVRYSLNSDSCGETMQAEISPSGSFVCEIPYANAEDSLTWRAEATASDVDTVLSAGPATITRAHDASRTCYTWTGAAGDNRWTNIGNWSAEKPDCYGYPGFYDAGWVTYVQFDRSTAPEGIDLEGGKYAFIDNGALIVGQDITVKMKNGTLYFAGGLPTFNDGTVGLIGASGTTLVFENVKFDNMSSKNLIPAEGSTLVFEGANATPGGWKYNPIKANTKFVVRNGTLTGNAFGTGTITASHVVEISNAVWSVTANIANAKSLAPKVVFRDGPDRAAQFITTGSFLTYGRYDIKIPAAGRALPAVKAKSRTGSSALTFDIDVTDYLSADRVPLFQFTSTTAQTMPSCTLNVTAGGVDVKAARNASLVFESNTLYYKQDEQSVVAQKIAKPVAVTGLVYTGEVLTGVAAGDGYTLVGATATDAGDYTATATLAEGYVWADDSTAALEIPWSIAQAQNAWTTEPSITKATWTTDEEAGVLTPAATQFGAPSATIAKDGGAAEAFTGTTLPTAAGAYVITYASSATANWLAPTPASKTVSFTIAEPAVPQPEPIEVTLFDEHPEWGYKVEGLGAAHDEMALVFTNQSATASWTLPADLDNIEFLVVGGGGGGGSDLYSDDVRQGGAGGGGGGVVTGVVAQVAKDAVLSVTVGAGGIGGVVGTKRSNNYGAAANGANSSFSVGGTTYVTALGGGGDCGSSKLNATGNAGGAGGSSAGSRPGNAAQTAPAGTASCINASALANILAYGVLGNAGGGGTTTAFYGYFFSAGGGGGATEAGGDATPFDGSDYDSAYWGGEGGEGLASDITGTTAVYGSGGGGGSVMSGSYGRGGHGGTGAGNGNVNSATGAGTSALPNLGGGGGGGGRGANGGRGGSGIVVLRFRVPGVAPMLPQVAGEDVEPAAVFTKAREAKSIVYPSEPTVTGEVGSQVISFGGVDVNVPDYYTATLSGTTVTLALNDNAKPVIADEDETPGIEIVDGKVRIHLGNVKGALYYTILTATSLDSANWTPCGAYELGQDDFEYDASGATRFYKASVRDEAE